MPSPKLERYAEIARNSTRRIPRGAEGAGAGATGTLDERICALIPDFRPQIGKSERERSDSGLMAAVPSLLWWGVVLIVFTLAR